LQDKSNELIPQEKLLDGMKLARNYAKYFFHLSKKYRSNLNYRLSILFGIFSFEESTKVLHMYKIIKKKRGITIQEWKDLATHTFKLTNLEKISKSNFEQDPDLVIEIRSMQAEALGMKSVIKNREQGVFLKNKAIEIQSKFEKIKEFCIYSNWDSYKKQWKKIDDIAKKEWRLINDLILFSSKSRLLFAQMHIEMLENPSPIFSHSHLFNDGLKKYFYEQIEHAKKLTSFKEFIKFETPSKHQSKKLTKAYYILNKHFSH